MSLQEKAFVAKKVARLLGQTKPSSPETPFLLRTQALKLKPLTRSMPDPAIDDHRPGGSDKALGALQPHRQTRQLGPFGERIPLHLRRIEDIAGLRAPARPFGNCRVGSRCAQ